MSFRARVFSQSVPAGTTIVLNGNGGYFRLITTSSACNLTFHSSSGEVLAEIIGVQAGFAIDAAALGDNFGRVDVYSAATQTVTAIVSTVPIHYDRLTGSVAVTSTPPATLDSLADDSIATGATELIAAADSDRHTLIVSNLAANTATFRIGDSGAAAANGIPLAPGETLVLDTSAAVYAYNPAAGAESLAIMAIKT